MIKKGLIAVAAVIILLNSCIVEKKYKETDIYSDYETENGFSVFHLPPILFKIVFSFADESDVNSKELLNKVDLIKILIFDESENTRSMDELKDSFDQKIKNFNYNLLTKIVNEDNNIDIYIIDIDGVIREVLVNINAKEDFISLNLIGELTKEDVFNIYKAIDTDNIKDYSN